MRAELSLVSIYEERHPRQTCGEIPFLGDDGQRSLYRLCFPSCRRLPCRETESAHAVSRSPHGIFLDRCNLDNPPFLHLVEELPRMQSKRCRVSVDTICRLSFPHRLQKGEEGGRCVQEEERAREDITSSFQLQRRSSSIVIITDSLSEGR
jgi:hypothetical protein